MKLVGVMLALLLAGCGGSYDKILTKVGADPTEVTRLSDKAIGAAVTPIPYYCAAPYNSRTILRDLVNGHEKIQGNMVVVWCVGDPPITLGAP